MRFIPLALSLLGLALGATAQTTTTADTTAPAPVVPNASAPVGLKAGKPAKKIKIIPLPVLFYQAETGLGYGGALILSGRFGQDTTTRPSFIRAQAWRTQKSQSLLQLVHTVFTPEEKYLLSGEISAYDILLFYYGNGNDTREADESNLGYKLLILNQRAQKQVANKLFAGVQYRFTNTTDITPEGNAKNGEPNVFLTEPRIGSAERQNHRTSLLGPVLTYDTRDNVSATFTGNYLDLTAMFGGTGLGSDFRFARYELDVRHFRPLFGSNRTILALQALGQFHTGDVPFRELAGLGANLGGVLYNNANLMRGIYEQRFRDRQMATFQAEVRHHLLWRFDAAVFGGVGQVGYKLSDFSGSGTKYAGGAGLRFNFVRRDRVNLRLDYAAGSGGFSGIYFSIGEAF